MYIPEMLENGQHAFKDIHERGLKFITITNQATKAQQPNSEVLDRSLCDGHCLLEKKNLLRMPDTVQNVLRAKSNTYFVQKQRCFAIIIIHVFTKARDLYLYNHVVWCLFYSHKSASQNT